jgi:hypothetical protein
MAEEPSKIKDLLAAVNTSSGANLGIKVDYAAGSMLEGSLNELKQSAKMQVDYLGKLVGFQEQSLKDARLKSVQGENTEGFQKGIGSDLKDAGKAGLNAALGAGGPLGELIGALGTGLFGAAKLAYKAIKPSNARENAALTTEERVNETRAQAKERARIAAEEKAKFDAKRIELENQAKARTAEAEKLRNEARAKANEARGERISERTGKRIYGSAANSSQIKIDNEARLSDLDALKAEKAAAEARAAANAARATAASGAGAAEEIGGLKKFMGGAKGLAGVFGELLGPVLVALGTGSDLYNGSTNQKNPMMATTSAVATNTASLVTGLIDAPWMLANAPQDLKSFATPESGQKPSMLQSAAGGLGGFLGDFGEQTGMSYWWNRMGADDYNPKATDKLRSLMYAEEKPDKYASLDTVDPMAAAMRRAADLEYGIDRDRQRSPAAPQSSSTPPIVVASPPSRPDGGGSNMINSNNTQNTTVIQKLDPATALFLGQHMLGYGAGAMPMN